MTNNDDETYTLQYDGDDTVCTLAEVARHALQSIVTSLFYCTSREV